MQQTNTGWSAFARAAGLCGVGAMVYLLVAGAAALLPTGGLGAAAVLLAAGAGQALALGLPALLLARLEGLSPGRLGLRSAPRGAVGQWLPLFLGAAMGANLLAALLRALLDRPAPTGSLPEGGAALALALAVNCLLPAVLEELLFRGVMAGLLAPFGGAAAVAGPAVLFALLHSEPGQCLTALVCGLVLGLLAQKAGSILPGMALHFVNNLLAFVSLYLNQYAPEGPALLASLALMLGGPVWGAWALYRRRGARPGWEKPLRPGRAAWQLLLCPAYDVVLLALAARLAWNWMGG